MASVCPFATSVRRPDTDACPRNRSQSELEPDPDETQKSKELSSVSPRCPLGYDSHTFKLGPLSCMLCQALLFQTSKCQPCSHKFCKECISRFKDCPLCGADIESIEPDEELQATVDRFIEGHARIKRPQLDSGDKGGNSESKTIIYGDVSFDRGAFLVQQAMRAFRSHNILSAKSRLIICAEDIREQIERQGSNSELCSQLGAVLGMLGDCCRAMEDSSSAVTFFEESVEFLLKLPTDDLEVMHTLSVSLNKIGDLKYYGGDLQTTRSYYARSLDVRRNSIKVHPTSPSQILDVAVSLAKVADVDRELGDEERALEGFQEAINCLESLKVEEGTGGGIEQKRQSVLDFLHSQLKLKEAAA